MCKRCALVATLLRLQHSNPCIPSDPPCLPPTQVLLVIAATHLDAVAFQIFSQSFKLVPTALFAYWLLGQMLEPMQARMARIICTCAEGDAVRRAASQHDVPCAGWGLEGGNLRGSVQPPLPCPTLPRPAVGIHPRACAGRDPGDGQQRLQLSPQVGGRSSSEQQQPRPGLCGGHGGVLHFGAQLSVCRCAGSGFGCSVCHDLHAHPSCCATSLCFTAAPLAAGVYFEKYVKGKHAASLWVRNIQLGIYGVPLRWGRVNRRWLWLSCCLAS